MTTSRAVVAVLAAALLLGGCDYVVVPPEASSAASGVTSSWTAVITAIEPADDGLAIAFSIRNDTQAWSAMEAIGARAATLTAGDGTTTACPDVHVGTGGHRLAPGFLMSGYVGGKKREPVIEPIRVVCPLDAIPPGAKLAIEYTSWTGEYNYYDPDATKTDARLEVGLDAPAAPASYPVATPIDGLLQAPGIEIAAINGVVLTLADIERAAGVVTFSWHTENPGEYPSSVHIGVPPVIGSDGVLYGFYESPDLESVPITPAGGGLDWTTKVSVPDEVTAIVILLSVESKKQRLFVNYAIEIGED